MNAPVSNDTLAVVTRNELDPALAPTDFHADLARAGAHVRSRWGMAWFLARRYPLGAVGLAIVVTFVLVAVFAPYITAQDPLATNPSISPLSGSPWATQDTIFHVPCQARVSSASLAV